MIKLYYIIYTCILILIINYYYYMMPSDFPFLLRKHLYIYLHLHIDCNKICEANFLLFLSKKLMLIFFYQLIND